MSANKPYLDQNTISSFKRTFNAALLLVASRPRRPRALARLASWKAAGVALVVVEAPHIMKIISTLT